MKVIKTVILSLVLGLVLQTHHAIAWTFELINGSGAGKLKACAATHEFRNAWITVRIYGEYLDIVYYHDDFAFPWGKMLGPALIQVDSASFLAVASSVDRSSKDVRAKASTMMIAPKPEEYGALFSALKNGREMAIIFPNGDVYPVPLKGSAKALQIVSECWLVIKTGPNDTNPFEVPPETNPFQTPAQQPVSNPFEQPA